MAAIEYILYQSLVRVAPRLRLIAGNFLVPAARVPGTG
jgi:hypothetical protein